MNRQILHTFDYELFLGPRSGKAEEAVVHPSARILEVLNLYGQKGIFFVDSLWLFRMKEASANNPVAHRDFNLVSEQLRKISEEGHYVFPHLHPHWLDAEFLPQSAEWSLNDYSHYTFANCDEVQREFAFSRSAEIFREILGKDWKFLGYRAGGWSIQPFEIFKPFFEKYSILADFSVLPGFWADSGPQAYDFSTVRFNQPYRFTNEILTPEPSGKFVEFPISVVKWNAEKWVDLWWRRIIYRLGSGKSFGKGIGVLGNPGSGKPAGQPLNSTHEMVSIELLTLPKLGIYLRYLEEMEHLHFISHPKMVSRHNIATLGKFLNRASRKYSLESDFMKMIPQEK